jgi:DNA-directed RNA polymerase subunit H (RpoH/RPB5)
VVAETPRNPLEVCRMTEYVKVKSPEIVYGKTNLLQSQLNLINLLKQYQEYEGLRKEEIFLKIDLKKKLSEASEFLEQLSKLLPESKFVEEQEKKEELQKEIIEKMEGAIKRSRRIWNKDWEEKGEEKRKSFIEIVKESETAEKEKKKPKLPLDQELEEIRKKLEKLQ